MTRLGVITDLRERVDARILEGHRRRRLKSFRNQKESARRLPLTPGEHPTNDVSAMGRGLLDRMRVNYGFPEPLPSVVSVPVR